MNKIVVQQQDFDLSTEVALLKTNDGSVGALVSFIGLVRDLTDTPIQKMKLEHYSGMTEKALQAIVSQAQERWEIGNTTIIHRVGELAVNEQIVLVITTSKHRKSAFEACEFIMDYLKTDAPFWKKEYADDNNSWWVKVRSEDVKQKNRWQDK